MINISSDSVTSAKVVHQAVYPPPPLKSLLLQTPPLARKRSLVVPSLPHLRILPNKFKNYLKT